MIEAATRAPERVSDLRALSGGRPILVLAPHPDDESLGCGALLAAAFAGAGAHVVCMTDGAASHSRSRRWPRESLAGLRAAELDAAIAALGGRPEDVTRLGLPDGGMPGLAGRFGQIAGRVAGIAGEIGARSLFAPSGRDPHCDHVATDRIAALAARLAGVRHLTYPIWSRWHGPDPYAAPGVLHRFDSTRYRGPKARAIACHRSQLGQVVTDDPGGFAMSAEFVALFRDGDELFHEAGS